MREWPPRRATESSSSALRRSRELEERRIRFAFFQPVRLLERLQPGGKARGRRGSLARGGTVRRISLGRFPPSEIQALQLEEARPPVMAVNFMGLTGPLGVLPTRYTGVLRSAPAPETPPCGIFLISFNHRLVSFLYRAWQKYRFAVACERGEEETVHGARAGSDRHGHAGLQNRQRVDDAAGVLYGACWRSSRVRPEPCEQMLADYFDVEVEVEQFAGAWCGLDADTRSFLKRGAGVGTAGRRRGGGRRGLGPAVGGADQAGAADPGAVLRFSSRRLGLRSLRALRVFLRRRDRL